MDMSHSVPIAVQFAMRGEAQPLLQAGEFTPIRPATPEPYGFEFYRGSTSLKDSVLVAVAGVDARHQVDAIGTLRAGLLTETLLREYSPQLLINAGTAGGFHAQGGAIGDVYLGQNAAVFHDRRINLPGGFIRFGEGHRSVLHESDITSKLGLKAGTVSSGDSLDCTPEDMKHLLRLGAAIKEMEAAAIATVCEAHRVPLVLLKSVTDIVDHHPELEGLSTEEQFLKNYSLAVSNLTTKLELLIQYYTQTPASLGAP
jgi:5'-methylthioadenosine nucleosidase